jgi:ParB family chromosome partitioning protein
MMKDDRTFDLIPVAAVLANPEQPRVDFDQDGLEELAQSIAEQGLIQPITVEAADEGIYILHDGERRLRAAKLAGLELIPALVQAPLNGTGSRDRLVRALVANVQRRDLNAVEEAKAYRRLQVEHGLSVAEISRRTGKAPVMIYARLDLLTLEAEILEHIAAGSLPHDRSAVGALKKIPDSQARVKLAARLAANRSSIQTVIAAAARMTNLLKMQAASGAPEEIGVPAVRYARRVVELPAWDLACQLGRVPPWEVVAQAAERTCRRCTLRDMASRSTCGDCPAVELVSKMIEMTAGAKHDE